MLFVILLKHECAWLKVSFPWTTQLQTLVSPHFPSEVYEWVLCHSVKES